MNTKAQTVTGHLLALLVISIWSVTYVATDLLLSLGFASLHILVIRFTLALLVLFAAKPKLQPARSLKEELGFFFLSLFGMGMYYVLENYAIEKTDGTNVSILISFAPILTTLGSALILKKDRITVYTILGFLVAITGVTMVVFNGTVKLDFDAVGYLLAIGAALCWAIYSMLLGGFLEKHDSIIITRRMLIYTLVMLIPLTLITDGAPKLSLLADPRAIICYALLSVFGGSLCYLWWNKATKRIGVVITTNYLYISPFITMVFAFFVTGTPISAMGALGAVLIIGGVVLADRGGASDKR